MIKQPTASQMLAAVAMLGTLMLTGGDASAEPWFGGAFSADIRLTHPRDPAQSLEQHLFVGDRKVRLEVARGQERRVLIMDFAQRQAYTLSPDQQTYHQGTEGAPPPPRPFSDRLPDDADSPCTQKVAQCVRTGQGEMVNGLTTDKWEVRGKDSQGREMVQTLWVSPDRHLVIRQMMTDGPTMDRQLLRTDQVAGRNAEVWQITSGFEGKSQSYQDWVDSKLKLVLKREVEGKTILLASKVTEGTPPEQAFVLPAGFREVAPPQPPEGAQAPGR
ncbi:MAG: hypothetical protein H7831_07385 [Magnetococcus sp. WYHC-3]